MPTKLTESAISKNAREAAASGKLRDLYDAGCRGLLIRLTPNGAKSFNLSCRDLEGKARKFPLGQYPHMGISEARNAARALQIKVKAGFDPAKEKAKLRATAKDAKAGIGTLAALLDHYGAVRGQELRSWDDCRRQISNVFRPHLECALATMTASDLQADVDKHPSKQAAAAAVRYVRPILRWDAKRRMVDARLAELDPLAKVKQRKRVLTDAELTAIWHATDAKGVPVTFGRLVRLLILTGQRREEVAAMAWPELSADRANWTLPSERVKNDHVHQVPLTEAARAILPPEPAAATRATDMVFPGATGTTPFAGWSKAKDALDTASGVTDWRIHDLRRTVATGLQRLGVRLEVTEAVLGHRSGSRAGVVGIYQQYEWTNEKRAALDGWADLVDAIVNGKAPASNVIPMQRAG